MCNARSGAKFAKKATKVFEVTSQANTAASAANRTGFSFCDLYIGADTGDILLNPMPVVNQRFIALRREAGTATLGSADFAGRRYASRKHAAACDVVKQAFDLSSMQSSISSHVSAPTL
jgi:hypothetical protein